MLKFTLLRKSTHVRFICVFPPLFVPLRMINFVPGASEHPGGWSPIGGIRSSIHI